jgi:hypothetical protein
VVIVVGCNVKLALSVKQSSRILEVGKLVRSLRRVQSKESVVNVVRVYLESTTLIEFKRGMEVLSWVIQELENATVKVEVMEAQP